MSGSEVSTTATSAAAASAATADAGEPIVGTVVRFTSDRTRVEVTIGDDSTAVRDFFGLPDKLLQTGTGVASTGAQARFRELTARLVGVLRGLGIDARIGAVPGEYCPGGWSINGAGRVKLAGTAQRIISGACLFGAELVVTDPDPIRAVLADVNAALDVEFDPRTASVLTDLNPAVTLDKTRAGIRTALGAVHEVTAGPDVMAEAIKARESHAP
ncbi:hypothetical protein OG921_16195 [Aldersonia sp. NBC_00410]|uniref:hypothetical protein n=1 Tax=Aldersonia sp. NBC_00410 TaxID=2975954 RepID=UPI002257A8EA|nr:hypothetical protein [Aldersonia sp. NBC_00410]MCX5044707.1 hypothetical protein [Aldersonia sp. NBC_00410]